MMTFYAAVGSYRIENRDGHKAPYIQKLGKLYLTFISCQEILYSVRKILGRYNSFCKKIQA